MIKFIIKNQTIDYRDSRFLGGLNMGINFLNKEHTERYEMAKNLLGLKVI